MDRAPAVAGTFYPSNRERLRRQLDDCFRAAPGNVVRERVIGAVVPHAGFVYSGHVAAAAYERIERPDRWIILSPNHTGYGSRAAINAAGRWLTPLGAMEVDGALARELMAENALLEEDERAHRREHSLEVQLPFLQYLEADVPFVPICLSLPSFERCRQTGEAIAAVVARRREAGETVSILASSDMNHYENQSITIEKDARAIERIVALDPEGLWETVQRNDITMCGIIPSTVMLVAAIALGARRAELVRHATSGDVTGDMSAVVGYASVVVT